MVEKSGGITSLTYIIRSMSRPQNWSKMIQNTLLTAHTDTAILSTKTCVSQTASVNAQCARQWRVVPLGQAWWFSWWCADNCNPYRFQCPIPFHYIFQCMIVSFSLSVQAAHQIAAARSGVSPDYRVRECHSDGYGQTCLAICAEKENSGMYRYSRSWPYACHRFCSPCNRRRLCHQSRPGSWS